MARLAAADDRSGAPTGPGPSWAQISANIDRIVNREVEEQRARVGDGDLTVRHDPSIMRDLEPAESEAERARRLIVETIDKAGIYLKRAEIWDRIGPPDSFTLHDQIPELIAEGVLVKAGRASGMKYGLADWSAPVGEHETDAATVDAQTGLEPDDEHKPAAEESPTSEPEAGPGPGPLVPPLTEPSAPYTDRAKYLDSDRDLDTYAAMAADLRCTYAEMYRRYLETLLDRFERQSDSWVADRIEKMLDGMVGWLE